MLLIYTITIAKYFSFIYKVSTTRKYEDKASYFFTLERQFYITPFFGGD